MHLADTDCLGNPELCEYNQVFLPYCSQDLWSGTANSTSDPSSPAPGYFFSGHLIFRAVIDDLVSKYGLDNASIVILSGDSAGLCTRSKSICSYLDLLNFATSPIFKSFNFTRWFWGLQQRGLAGRTAPKCACSWCTNRRLRVLRLALSWSWPYLFCSCRFP